MTSWQTSYWRLFNVGVRTFGLTILAAGLVFLLWGFGRMAVWGGLPPLQSPLWVLPLVGLLSAGLGIAVLRGPPYRPDLGDVFWQFDPKGVKTAQSTPGRYDWWTGDR